MKEMMMIMMMIMMMMIVERGRDSGILFLW
jgi:hypothetical protein